MLNQVILIGHAGRDAESRYTPAGKLVASFSMAVSEGKDKPPIWVRISAWEKLGEVVANYVTKGKQVAVVGRLSPVNVYTDRSGKPAASYEVTATNIQLLGSREDGDNAGAQARAIDSVTVQDANEIPF